MNKRLLIFGGAFNPPHRGHMQLLEQAIENVKPAVTLVLPTSVSPHKVSGDISFSHRFNMAKVFTSLDTVKLSGIENRGKRKKNYTIKTIKWIEKSYKGYDIYLLIGSDMVISFSTWSRYRRILAKVTLVVAAREQDDTEFKDAIDCLKQEGAKIRFMKSNPIVISSSQLREAIHNIRDVGEYLDDSVLAYIKKNSLYI
ncbi:MAG: nicotinate (nicotinamide) nucleotide adenylyltransferase [Oscillospiraceae bacterium]|nr:nicotinate (nicotinamide) nucleotide adenylyltransferase [Oscillospiraceae bacterium]